MNPIRIVIADDHIILREGITAILSKRPEFEVVGHAANGRSAVEEVCRLQPDIVLLDVNMPKLDGVRATRLIRQKCPQTQCLILTMHTEDEFFFDALKAGAAGYILKGAGSIQLIEAIKIVASGNVFISPSMTKKLVNSYLQSEKDDTYEQLDQLTSRELDVMPLLAEGLTNREIAEKLFISTSTVQTHRTHIMEKLELTNRADLIRFAMQHKLI